MNRLTVVPYVCEKGSTSLHLHYHNQQKIFDYERTKENFLLLFIPRFFVTKIYGYYII